MKILPEGKPSLDGLLLLKAKNNIIRKSLGHPEVQKLYIIKYRVLLTLIRQALLANPLRTGS
jgi:hypothetical protein